MGDFGAGAKGKRAFGIKKNEWKGRIYVKDASEQRADGSFYIVKQTQWRAYDSWEESVLDHNSYIASRSIDGERHCAMRQLSVTRLQACGRIFAVMRLCDSTWLRGLAGSGLY